MTLQYVYGRKKSVNVGHAQPYPVADAARMTKFSVRRIESLRDAGVIKRGGKDEKQKVIVAKWFETLKGEKVARYGLPLVDQTPPTDEE